MTRLHESSDTAIDAWTGGDFAACHKWLGDDVCLKRRGHEGDCGDATVPDGANHD